MKNSLLYGILGLLIGFGGGYLSSHAEPHSDKITMSDERAASMATGSAMDMHHAMLEVDSAKPVPTVSVEAIPDSKDGYNIHLTTTNYTFTPEKVGQAPIANQGHAHLYVNGVKVARLYGDWFNLSASTLKAGENAIEVTLNANDHSEWVIDGKHIAADVSVTK